MISSVTTSHFKSNYQITLANLISSHLWKTLEGLHNKVKQKRVRFADLHVNTMSLHCIN